MTRDPPRHGAAGHDPVHGERPAAPTELAALRAELAALIAAAAANEAKLARSLERELALMGAESLPDLLREATEGVAQAYGLRAVTLALEDPAHELRHLLLALGERADDLPDVVFADSLVGLTPVAAHLTRPWLGAYQRADHDLLFRGAPVPASVALLPLLVAGRLVGLLCLGAADPGRFDARLASDFLNRLGTVLAVCLDNATNRARVMRSGLADYLTGWQSRRYLHARLREELARAARQGTSIACVMVDVDHFKAINDTYGHLAGDKALREITARIDGQIRASDTAARFGGDEFALLLPESTVAAALQFAERIRVAMRVPVEVKPGCAPAVTLSTGVAAVLPARAERDLKGLAERLLSEADNALYRAKALGRDRVESA